MVVETHISHLFLVGDRVYKLKKPVRTGFLDFSSRERRERACRHEVALNRRLSADVYLGVWTVSDEEGRPLDHLVVMRRMPDDRRLSTLVRAGADVSAGLREVARRVAALHARAEPSEAVSAQATRDAVRANWEANFEEMATFAGPVLDRGDFERARALSLGYLAGRKPLFDDRIAAGEARDGHGDLLAEDIFLLDDGPRIIDCLEFDDRLRYGDVLLDAAFLAMDLERLGAPELGRRFLAWYQEDWGRGWPASLAHHYVAYRAQVRAKVACIRHRQGDPDAAAKARQRHDLCLRHLEQGRVRLVLVGGSPGTGKSTLARGLVSRWGWELFRSDEVRKDLAGMPHASRASAPLDEGLYSPERVDATYAELLRRARTALGRGEPVVLDASWARRHWREEAARVARETAAELVQLRCEAPVELAAGRVAARLSAGGDASDAQPEVAKAIAGSFDPWPEAASVPTTGGIDDSLAEAGAVLSQRATLPPI